MYKARKNVEIKGKKRDIIEEYANFGQNPVMKIFKININDGRKCVGISIKFTEMVDVLS